MDWKRFDELVELTQKNKTQEAISGLTDLVSFSENPADNAAVLLTIAACQRKLRRPTDARKILDDVRSLPGSPTSSHARALFLDASIDLDQGDWEHGLEKLDMLRGKFSSVLDESDNEDLLEDIQKSRGIALYELNRPKEARPLLEQALSLEHDKGATLYYLGRCCYDLGDLDAAREYLERALAIDLHPVYQPSAHYVLGLAYHWQGQNARAIREFEWCLDHDREQRVAKWKVLTGLLNASKTVGLMDDANRYSKLLKSERHVRDAK